MILTKEQIAEIQRFADKASSLRDLNLITARISDLVATVEALRAERDEAAGWADRWRKYEGQPLYKEIVERIREMLSAAAPFGGGFGGTDDGVRYVIDERDDLRAKLAAAEAGRDEARAEADKWLDETGETTTLTVTATDGTVSHGKAWTPWRTVVTDLRAKLAASAEHVELLREIAENRKVEREELGLRLAVAVTELSQVKYERDRAAAVSARPIHWMVLADNGSVSFHLRLSSAIDTADECAFYEHTAAIFCVRRGYAGPPVYWGQRYALEACEVLAFEDSLDAVHPGVRAKPSDG